MKPKRVRANPPRRESPATGTRVNKKARAEQQKHALHGHNISKRYYPLHCERNPVLDRCPIV